MSEETPAGPEHTVTVRVLPILLLALSAGAIGYSWHEHNVAKKVGADNAAMTASLAATRDQLNGLIAKVNTLQTQPAPEPAASPAAAIYQKPLAAAVSRHRIRRVEDPRWKKMQGQLDEQGRAIESTRQDLSSARTELTGSIAKTHDELVLLEKKGERNYYEFDVDKTGQFQRQGPISIRLKKANTKHDYADLELLVDDSKLSKKHVNVYEPVVFYPADDKVPVEIVINSITKNHIHGYVSAAKYRSEDLQATANSAVSDQGISKTDQTNSDGKPSPVRQRLPAPTAPRQ